MCRPKRRDTDKPLFELERERRRVHCAEKEHERLISHVLSLEKKKRFNSRASELTYTSVDERNAPDPVKNNDRGLGSDTTAQKEPSPQSLIIIIIIIIIAVLVPVIPVVDVKQNTISS